MTSSDSQIAVARKIDPEPAHAANVANGRDTWPSPAPGAPVRSPDDTDKHDTIPTPPPELATTDDVVIPPLRRVSVDEA